MKESTSYQVLVNRVQRPMSYGNPQAGESDTSSRVCG
jgi:hypothetical protein